MSGIAEHTNKYSTGVRLGSWVEDTFGNELAQREYVVDKNMYLSESREHQSKTAKIAAAEGATTAPETDNLLPTKATIQNINLFKPKPGERSPATFESTMKSHYKHPSFRSTDSNALRRKLQKNRDVELAERNTSAASLANARSQRAYKRLIKTNRSETPVLSYDAKKIKSAMEKKTSLW
eukprot:g4332.t1